ncbi:MAG TPA: COX15/CtaA family protein [Balneolaceae bacterium]|nr:COX15/CtaA family protein [Balneolaceae bacterium]
MSLNIYQKTAIAALGTTVFLIFVGGMVRLSGAGLGCPDWPRCFGSWIPPGSAATLPARFDASQFNLFKMWTEYVNRLTGITTGLLILATAVMSFRYRKREPAVFYSSIFALGLVLIEGWQGGQVVHSQLKEWQITTHMILALVIMLALIYAIFKTKENQWSISFKNKRTHRWISWISLGLFAVTLVQIILGTQVRASVDGIAQPGGSWLSGMGAMIEIHRSFSWAIFLPGIALSYLAWQKAHSGFLQKITAGLVIIIILQIMLGAGLYYISLSPAFEVLHILGAALMLGLEFSIILVVGIFPRDAKYGTYGMNPG